MFDNYTNEELWNMLQFYNKAPRNNMQAKDMREQIKEEIYSRGSHFCLLEEDKKELEKFLNNAQFK